MSTVLGMYDRDFSKPFNKRHANKVNREYHERTGKWLSNLDKPEPLRKKSPLSKALDNKKK